MAKNFNILRDKMTDEQKRISEEKFKAEIERINNQKAIRNAGFLKNTKNTPAPANFDCMNEDEIFQMFNN